MPATYVNIASANGDGSSNTLTFSSIPQTYTDLVVRVSGRSASNPGLTYTEFFMRPNNDTANATFRFMQGTGSGSGTSSSDSPVMGARINSSTATALMYGNLEFYIPNYRVAINKEIFLNSVTETNGNPVSIFQAAGLWRSTNAITSLVFVSNSGAFTTDSTFYLYGIKNS